ncbi:MAG: T9SS type A sorting domain-containing protein [Bacteroidia bacterium]|nr:T9SS type A sorting domain-containing protein [Bacteroidia bacterium]MBT8269336.1 T9SS type A sorting domain-containing protein [Bacteroidia bacterium]NNK70729.1 T9SS type A sorting domain-containing protein [Flavobacteriaceae bacterium]NNL80843.1 T9SS type A sorting domain-containing protein [Flavobacteriaceae bacterium]
MKQIVLFYVFVLLTCFSAIQAQNTIWSNNFESLSGISAQDLDGDGFNWFQNSDGTLMGFSPGRYLGSYSLNTSPDNALECPVFSIPAGASDLSFSLRVASSSQTSYAESFAVYIQEDGTGSMFDNEIYQGTLNSGGPGSAQLINGSIPNSFAGKDVKLIVRHFNTTNQLLFMIDDILVESGQALSVGDSSFDQFNFYPNPADNQINFNSAVNISKVQIFNLLGQNVSSFSEGMLSNKTIDVSALQSGAYLLKVEIDNNTQIFRFIKN